jgi:putative IMPACT (imprinted ancient) family translation regulator
VVGYPQVAQRSSDDGEPAGTAGVPMLDVLRRKGLTDTVAVVSRYFGGVLLGAGGLIRAYGAAVAGAVAAAGTTARERVSLLALRTDHAHAGALEHGLRATGRAVRDVAYRSDGVRIEVGLPPAEVTAFRVWLAQATGGAATASGAGETYADRRLD